ncbi:MAG: hypothetical protein Sylvanvirus19_14 [Sylvanvirus sp.]|uniref:Uncharacterized protein n=1 Tax=Sylvanvirus sp. TaxID=2487774 RepID=A0A3G5AK35_9VIRU|nr:MAG: hypothetical protein Sylvanvirus19_14 [Sylvanvirus sp.]
MTFPAQLYSTLQGAGLIGGAYIGYRCAYGIHQMCLDSFPAWRTRYGSWIEPSLSSNPLFPERVFLQWVGAGVGICVSWILPGWVLTIPLTLYFITKDYPDMFQWMNMMSDSSPISNIKDTQPIILKPWSMLYQRVFGSAHPHLNKK